MSRSWPRFSWQSRQGTLQNVRTTWLKLQLSTMAWLWCRMHVWSLGHVDLHSSSARLWNMSLETSETWGHWAFKEQLGIPSRPCYQEGWVDASVHRLLQSERNNFEGFVPFATHRRLHRCTPSFKVVLHPWSRKWLLAGPYASWWHWEDGVHNSIWP